MAHNIDTLHSDSTKESTEITFQDSIANLNLLQKQLKLSRDAYNEGIQLFELKIF